MRWSYDASRGVRGGHTSRHHKRSQIKPTVSYVLRKELLLTSTLQPVHCSQSFSQYLEQLCCSTRYESCHQDSVIRQIAPSISGKSRNRQRRHCHTQSPNIKRRCRVFRPRTASGRPIRSDAFHKWPIRMARQKIRRRSMRDASKDPYAVAISAVGGPKRQYSWHRSPRRDLK